MAFRSEVIDQCEYPGLLAVLDNQESRFRHSQLTHLLRCLHKTRVRTLADSQRGLQSGIMSDLVEESFVLVTADTVEEFLEGADGPENSVQSVEVGDSIL